MANNTTTNYIVYVKEKPFVIVDRKAKVDYIFKKAEKKGYEDLFEYRKITTNTKRIKEIATNIFDRKLTDFQRKNILQIRNKLVIKVHDIMGTFRVNENVAWEKIRSEHGLNDLSYTEFCRWVNDIMEFCQ